MRRTVLLTALGLFALSLPASGQDADYVLSVSSGEGEIGESVTVDVTFTLSGEPVMAWQFGLCHDEAILGLAEEDNAYGADMLEDPTFETIIDQDGGWVAAALFNVVQGPPLAPGDDLDMYHATYSLLAAGSAGLDFCDNLGSPPVSLSMVIQEGGSEIVPATEDGSIEVSLGSEGSTVAAVAAVARGDIDASGDVRGLADGVYLLTWAFSEGPEPVCLDAADVDDDGRSFRSSMRSISSTIPSRTERLPPIQARVPAASTPPTTRSHARSPRRRASSGASAPSQSSRESPPGSCDSGAAASSRMRITCPSQRKSRFRPAARSAAAPGFRRRNSRYSSLP